MEQSGQHKPSVSENHKEYFELYYNILEKIHATARAERSRSGHGSDENVVRPAREQLVESACQGWTCLIEDVLRNNGVRNVKGSHHNDHTAHITIRANIGRDALEQVEVYGPELRSIRPASMNHITLIYTVPCSTP